jgi:predicted O-linked N-acetylglucosamine transferase (SPINDLY family)
MFKWLFGTRGKAAPKPITPGPSNSAGAGIAEVATRRPIDAALQHHQAGRLEEADACYRAMLEANPDDIDALHFSGVVAHQRGEHERAAQLISKALSLNPSNVPAQNNLGNVLGSLGRQDEAIASYRKALALAPDYVDALANLGNALGARGDLDESVACYEKAVALAPGSPEARFSLANAYKDRGRLDDAAASYRNALALKPESAEICNNLGSVLYEQGKEDEAIAAFRRALSLKPAFAEALFNMGNVYRNRKQLGDAVEAYQAALVLEPAFLDAHLTLGMAFADLGRRDQALDSLRTALSLDPGHAGARWVLAMCRTLPVDESEAEVARNRAAFSSELIELERWCDAQCVVDGSLAVGLLQPFGLAYQEDDNRELLLRYGNLCARLMAGWHEGQRLAPTRRKGGSAGAIRVGVVSAQFHDHSVWNAIVKGWFQKLDRERVSLHAFHVGSDADQETRFAATHASRFEQGKRGVRQWVEVVRDAHPDVLIYPEIGMSPMAVRLASLRLAPVQVACWGHPETTGLPTIDYYLSAEDLEPEGAQANYTERLVALPHLGCFVEPGRVEAVVPDLGKWGIDARTPLLLCPGTPFKYAPQHDRIFLEIAQRLGRCRFVFFIFGEGNLSEKLRRRLEGVFAGGGLDSGDFVSFIPWQNRAGFAGWLTRADVFLDTIGFSGFNTALQAAECGLPIVTREGRFLRGRLASGILKRMRLPELVASTEQDYVALAVRLARDAEYRRSVRGRIAANRQVLFEDIAPIRALEAFLLKHGRSSTGESG